MQDITAIQSALRNQEYSLSTLVAQYLERIESTQSLNIYIDVYDTEIKEQAKIIDEKLAANHPLGRCFGMVISVKDVICQKEKKVTAASGILQNFESLYTATALQRLIDEDALVIGKVNCDQFGMGSSNENSVYGPTRNADNDQYTPGGSSGASAVSVQAGTCLLALGSDTGGSVRQPAGFTGLFGLKPTYGRISRYGLIAYGSSFDQIGLLGKNMAELALALNVMAGMDPMDPTSVDHQVPDYSQALSTSSKPLKIAFFKEAINHEGLDPQIKTAHENLIQKLESQGHTCSPVGFDLLDYIVPTYYTLTTAEASTNLSRYDGLRYGHQEKGQKDLTELVTANRTAGFSMEVKRRIMLGSFVLSTGYYEAYYGKAQKIRRMLKDRVEEIFGEYDLILMPISPMPAWEIGQKRSSPTEMYLADIYTVLANLVGNPALALPLSTHKNGLKFGFQVLSKGFSEEKLLNFAQYYNS